ncbi:MAG TPA: hypothetical protein VF591_18900 [Pyrinomonadaceae bacterium]
MVYSSTTLCPPRGHAWREPHADDRRTILESSAPAERPAADTFQTRVRVPAGGKTNVTYTVETK